MKIRTISFATLYDHAYLSRGLALYQSLKGRCSCDFEMYVLTLDYDTFSFLNKVDGIKVITTEEVIEEYPVLKRLREERCYQEFYWTLSSFFTQYVMRVYKTEVCIYVDADIYFWDDPCILINEMIHQKKSVLITEHNYFYKYDQTITSGKFCVQFMPFLNDLRGNEVLEWWRKKCEEKCCRDADGETFGDQKYLDDWETRFEESVHNCKNIGAGIAPWNCQKYSIDDSNGNKVVRDKVSGVSRNIIFYHYHELRALMDNCWNISSYEISDDFRTKIYRPYIELLDEIEKSFNGALQVSHPEYKMVNKYLFYPIPYLKERHLKISYQKQEKNQYVINANLDEGKTFNIDLLVMTDGTLRITNVDDRDLFLNNLHEIVWHIQAEFMFKTDDMREINYQILWAIKEKHHIKLEWIIEREGDYRVEHPIYDKLELVEIPSENRYISQDNLYVL